MIRRTFILGIITVLVVIYGAWDLIQTRSKRHSASHQGIKIAAATAKPSIHKNTLLKPSPLPGGDAPEAQKQRGSENKSQREKTKNPSGDLQRLPRVAGLTLLQRQRMEMEWGRDPFIRADLEWRGGSKGLQSTLKHDEAKLDLALKGIVRFGARRIAIINDKTYLAGDLVAGWRVEKIGTDRVVMQKGDERLTLVMQRPEEVR